ncbi:MAG: hypothetical protein KF773_22885 [Deltaproteobacteria bacterium]|nr:hypothetical protein [Deltaproteobacteria bacterium]
MAMRGVTCTVLVGLAAGCGGKREPAREAEPPAKTSDVRASDAAAPAAAVVDAAPAVAAVVADAAAAPAGLVIDKVPEFGCLGWSPRRRIAACIGGRWGFNIGVNLIELTLVAASPGAPAPDPITLSPEGAAAFEKPPLAPELVTQLAGALEGFVPWDRAAPAIELQPNKPGGTSTITVGGAKIDVRVSPAPPGHSTRAPAHRVKVTARIGGTAHLVGETLGPISEVKVRAFPLDKDVVVVEQIHHLGDEGTTGDLASFWLCTAAGCSSRGPTH